MVIQTLSERNKGETTTNTTGMESGENVSTVDIIVTPNIFIVYFPGGKGDILTGELSCSDDPPSVLMTLVTLGQRCYLCT
jgi:hypothetical protein